MQIWLDTIDEDVISDGVKTGIIYGVTTNPGILSSTKNLLGTLEMLLEVQSGPVAVQVTSEESEEMIEEGMRIFEFSPRMIVKVPINRQGLIAIKQLRHKNIPILGTGIIFPTQALLASNHGVSYIAPYFRHMKEIGDPLTILKSMVDLLEANNSSTKILVASLSTLEDLMSCASLGVAAVTIKPELYHKLIAHQPIVEKFTEKFLSDWTQAHGKISIGDVVAK